MQRQTTGASQSPGRKARNESPKLKDQKKNQINTEKEEQQTPAKTAMQPNMKKTKQKDDKDLQIEKLKAQNLKLRNRIKELNVVVEKAIEKANAKRVIMQKHKNENQDVSHLLQIRDKEIANAQKQIDVNNVEIARLQQKVDALTGVDKLIQLENHLKEVKQEKRDLERQIRNQEKCNKDQGKALDKITNDVDKHIQIKNLIEELRIWKEKVKKLEYETLRDEETRKEQLMRIKDLENQNSKYSQQLEEVKQKRARLTDNDEMQEVNAEKLATENDNKKLEFKQEEKRQKFELKQMEDKVRLMQEKVGYLRQTLKEKEQEQRISQFRLNEIRRTIKHNQLKPLREDYDERVDHAMEHSLQGNSHSLSKKALQHHNQQYSKDKKERNQKSTRRERSKGRKQEEAPEEMKKKFEKKLSKFEDEDQVADEVEKQIQAKLGQMDDSGDKLDRKQTIPNTLGK